MKRCILAVALACLAGSSLADVTYTYTGRPLSTGNPAAPFAPLTIVLDFASDGSALLDWRVSEPEIGVIDASNVYTLANHGVPQTPAFYLYTDASGAVSDWFINVAVLESSSAGRLFFSPWAQSFYGVVQGTPPLEPGTYAEEGIPGGYSVNTPGTWTVSGGVLPDFGYGDRAQLSTLATPMPEPAPGLLLLAGGIAFAVWRRTRVVDGAKRRPDGTPAA